MGQAPAACHYRPPALTDRTHPVVHKRGLSESCFAANEDNLPRRSESLFKPGIQFAALRCTADYTSLVQRRFEMGHRLAYGALPRGTPEAVTSPVDGLDETGLVHGVG